jgi:hypothetical protein
MPENAIQPALPATVTVKAQVDGTLERAILAAQQHAERRVASGLPRYETAQPGPNGEHPVLRFGCAGPEVETLGRLLDPDAPLRDVFDERMLDELLAFQQRVPGLLKDGVAGAETWKALEALNENSMAALADAQVRAASRAARGLAASNPSRGTDGEPPVLRFGDEGPEVAAFAARLAERNKRPVASGDPKFNRALLREVLLTQRALGISSDGVVDARMHKALAAPAATPASRDTFETTGALMASLFTFGLPLPVAPVNRGAPASESYLAVLSGRLTIPGTVVDETTARLVGRRAAFHTIIEGHEATIRALEAEVASIEQRIAAKTSEARSLLDRKARLVREISGNRNAAAVTGVYGALLGFFTAGIGTAVGIGMAAAGAAAVAKLQSDLSDAERSERTLQAEVAGLEQASRAHQATQRELRAVLTALRTERDAMDKLAPQVEQGATSPRAIAMLQAAVTHDERVIKNLEVQIATLRAMKVNAGAFESTLDTLIAKLRNDITVLEAQRVESQRTLLGAFLDVVIVAYGATAGLRAMGVAKADKTLLLSAIDLSRGDVGKTLGHLVDAMVAHQLIPSGATANALTLLTGIATQGSPARDYRSAIQTLALSAAPLSKEQNALLRLLENVIRFDPIPLARAVIELGALSAEQVDTVGAVLAGSLR